MRLFVASVVFPARAGVILSNKIIVIQTYGISRTRGGDPSAMDKIDEEIEVFPARAGVIPGAIFCTESTMGISRTRGGDPTNTWNKFEKELYFPHARG